MYQATAREQCFGDIDSEIDQIRNSFSNAYGDGSIPTGRTLHSGLDGLSGSPPSRVITGRGRGARVYCVDASGQSRHRGGGLHGMCSILVGLAASALPRVSYDLR